MRVKCIKNYGDRELNKNVGIGEIFEVSEARANVLIFANVCEAVEPEVEKEPTEAAEPTKEEKAAVEEEPTEAAEPTKEEKAAEPADKPAKKATKKK